MLSALLSSTERAARSLDEAEIRGLWALRLRNSDLMPDIEPEVDYRKFRAYFDGDARVLVVRDARSEPLGFFLFHPRVVTVGSARRVVVHAVYGYVEAAHRGGLAARIGTARGVVGILARFRCLDLAAVSVSYPASVVAESHYARCLSTLRDPDLAAWRREVLEAFVREVVSPADYDAEAGVVRMRNRPSVAPHVPRSERGRRTLAWYEARNPRWREGWGLPLMVECDAASTARGALRALGFP